MRMRQLEDFEKIGEASIEIKNIQQDKCKEHAMTSQGGNQDNMRSGRLKALVN